MSTRDDGSPQQHHRDIVVVGASQGGVEALLRMVPLLPRDLPAAVFVVMHTLPARKSLLPGLLDRAGPLRAAEAVDGEEIQAGRIYVAPPDQHLLVGSGVMRVLHGPKVNGHRPAVDPLFRSAADSYATRVIGVVLSGGRDCGTVGLQDIKRRGGIAIVQDPQSAECADMPMSALAHVDVDHRATPEEIALMLDRLTREAVRVVGAERGKNMAAMDDEQQSMSPKDSEEYAKASQTDFSCPDCGGVLRMVEGEHGLVHFRCRIGHAMTLQALDAEQEKGLDLALSTALRALSENADLSRRVAQRLYADPELRALYERKATHADAQAALIRAALLDRDPSGARAGRGDELLQWTLGLPANERARIARAIAASLERGEGEEQVEQGGAAMAGAHSSGNGSGNAAD